MKKAVPASSASVVAMTMNTASARGTPRRFNHDTSGSSTKPTRIDNASGTSRSRPKYSAATMTAPLTSPLTSGWRDSASAVCEATSRVARSRSGPGAAGTSVVCVVDAGVVTSRCSP